MITDSVGKYTKISLYRDLYSLPGIHKHQVTALQGVLLDTVTFFLEKVFVEKANCKILTIMTKHETILSLRQFCAHIAKIVVM